MDELPSTVCFRSIICDAFDNVAKITNGTAAPSGPRCKSDLVSEETMRFLSPFRVSTIPSCSSQQQHSSSCEEHKNKREALQAASERLLTCVTEHRMPQLGPVGLLKDEPTLLAFVEECGNAWLSYVNACGRMKDDAHKASQAIVDLCCGDTNFKTIVEGIENESAKRETVSLCGEGDAEEHAVCSQHSTARQVANEFTGDVARTIDTLKAISGFASAGGGGDQPCKETQNGKKALLHTAVLARLVCARILFGFRITIGTVTAVGVYGMSIPDRDLLVASFSRPHCPPREILSVGARALAKHIHRDVSSSWWGDHHLKGSQGQKNTAASTVLMRVLNATEEMQGKEPFDGDKPAPRSSWRNFHVLPHGFVAYELRVPEGYGARWQINVKQIVSPLPPDDSAIDSISRCGEPLVHSNSNGKVPTTNDAVNESFLISPDDFMFRGFLEPHDEDGHAKGWQH